MNGMERYGDAVGSTVEWSSSRVRVGFLQVLRFPPTAQRDAALANWGF